MSRYMAVISITLPLEPLLCYYTRVTEKSSQRQGLYNRRRGTFSISDSLESCTVHLFDFTYTTNEILGSAY